MPLSNQKKEECTGNCPNSCKVHNGEFQFYTNPGCICHKVSPSDKTWEETTESILRSFNVWSQDLEVALLRYWTEKNRQELTSATIKAKREILKDIQSYVQPTMYFEYPRGYYEGYRDAQKKIREYIKSLGINLEEPKS